MSVYTPESNSENFNYNPNKDKPGFIFNSGYPIIERDMNKVQRINQTEILNSFRDMIKYPGIVRVQS